MQFTTLVTRTTSTPPPQGHALSSLLPSPAPAAQRSDAGIQAPPSSVAGTVPAFPGPTDPSPALADLLGATGTHATPAVVGSSPALADLLGAPGTLATPPAAAGSVPAQRRGLPLSGFTSAAPSPFHFGAARPPPARSKTPPTPPPKTDAIDGGLPLIEAPDVAGTRAVWVAQLDKLAALPGADLVLIEEVRSYVLHGVRAVFADEPPPPMAFANTWTFEQNKPECMERLRVYMDLGSLAKLSAPPPPGGYVQPLHAVLKPGKKTRVCVDLSRHFNDFLFCPHFKYSSVQSAVDLALECGPQAFFVKLDISSCFLSFPIHPDDLKYFVCEAGGDFYQWLGMMFGLKTAPRIASLLLDVVSSALSDAGIEHTRYLDDFFIVATTASRAWACAHAAATIIKNFGLALSPGKVEGPLHRLEFLGIVLDSELETLSISAKRKGELMALLAEFQGQRWASVKRVQSLLGKLSFASTVLPGARPFMRRIIDLLAGRPSGRLRLGAAFKADLAYWQSHLERWNGRAKWRSTSATPFVFASDASTSGFAYGMESCPPAALAGLTAPFAPGHVRAGVWSASNGDAARQAPSSAIQWGEFFCPLAAAVEFGPVLRDRHVVFVVDNESDVFVINRLRTRDLRLSALLRALCDTSMQFNFSFEAVHRAGKSNILMDWSSRPALHKFSSDPRDVPKAPAVVSGGGVGLSAARFPPLLIPSSITYINSRCLSFGSKGDSASWTSSSSGW